ncbi:MAG: deoxyguanosinetriphosphate triphosphohydrolase [Planctomycetota bacterium]|nr:MAG: deoxyguanosinetriphosphate triphosphohydrolase [Planctomycetota bacterium]
MKFEIIHNMTSTLAQYAVTENTSRGRLHDEPPHRYRAAFERDRDRVIHCAAFRRLEGKTQVFTTGVNDQYRTRLTHTIEVAQIGRTLARCLNLNEALTEAICLAHDLGHAPFGHNGEHILNSLMKNHGGFEHNRQSVRVVDFIERPYPDFIGLNLSFETRLGLMKHASPYDRPDTVGDWPKHPTLEGQIADIADRIAYNCHDLEDGLRSRLLDESQLEGLSLYQQACEKAQMDTITDTVIRRTRLAKTMLDILASDAIEASGANLAASSIESVEQVLNHSQMLIGISETADATLQQLEAFLMQNMYLHPALAETTQKTKQWLSELFEHLITHPNKMPRYYQQMIDTEGLQRTTCDYIAGMTDRYCLKLVQEIV